MATPSDLVIDTNVLLHAENPKVTFHEQAKRLLKSLLECDVVWALDKGFDLDEAKNRSHILSEYRANLLPTDLGLVVLARLALAGRVREHGFGSSHVRRRIAQLIWNKMDRKFVGVTTETHSKVLASHDYVDFPVRKRREIQDEISVNIVDAAVAADLCLGDEDSSGRE